MTPTMTLVEANATAQRYQGTETSAPDDLSAVASVGCAGWASVLIVFRRGRQPREPRRGHSRGPHAPLRARGGALCAPVYCTVACRGRRIAAMTRILRRFGILSLIALFAVVGCGSGPSTATSVAPAALADAPTFSDAGLTQIRDTIGADITNQQIAGAVALLYADSEVKFFESFGSRDREGDRPMSNDTVFAIASMTKPTTSFAVMMLHEEGHFELDDPVSTYIPELGGLEVGVEDGDGEGDASLRIEPAERDMTIRDLLRHTSGLTYGLFGNSQVDRMYLDGPVVAQLSGTSDATLADMVRTLATLPLKHQPGAQFEYSVSTDVLGRLVEVFLTSGSTSSYTNGSSSRWGWSTRRSTCRRTSSTDSLASTRAATTGSALHRPEAISPRRRRCSRVAAVSTPPPRTTCGSVGWC